MVAGHVNTISVSADSLSYRDVIVLEAEVHRTRSTDVVVLDLANTDEATTAGFARLVVLRRDLKRSGGDLYLLHLHGQAKKVYEVNRMAALLPCDAD